MLKNLNKYSIHSLRLSNSLQADLKAKNNPEVSNQELKDISNKYTPNFKFFQTFVNSHGKILNQYADFKKNAGFKTFFHLQEKNPTLNYLTFGDSLIEPVHRCLRYELLLRKLLKNTPSEDRSYEDIQIALSEIIKV